MRATRGALTIVSVGIVVWVRARAHQGCEDSNINIQMNYWFAEITDMDVVKPLFDYFEVCAYASSRV